MSESCKNCGGRGYVAVEVFDLDGDYIGDGSVQCPVCNSEDLPQDSSDDSSGSEEAK